MEGFPFLPPQVSADHIEFHSWATWTMAQVRISWLEDDPETDYQLARRLCGLGLLMGFLTLVAPASHFSTLFSFFTVYLLSSFEG
jgi:hypothetical protein